MVASFDLVKMQLSGRMEMVALFAISTTMMALKPVLLHMTRDEESGNDALPPEIFQLAVEVIKVAIACIALTGQWVAGVPSPVWRGAKHTCTFALPAVVYLVMNIMAVHSARLLKPPTFQLVANVKIMCTALASWLLLGRTLTATQWCAMAVLSAGIIISQWTWNDDLVAPPVIGIAMMLCCSCLSACGGVMTEKALKSPGSSGMSIFATNLHLALHTLLINCIVQGLRVGTTHRQFTLQRPSLGLAVAMLNEAANGILISTIMKRADSIVKNYAFSTSSFITAGLSAFFLAYWPPLQFFVGAILTVFSIMLYTLSLIHI